MKYNVTLYNVYAEVFEIDLGDEELPEHEIRDDFKGVTPEQRAIILCEEGEGIHKESSFVTIYDGRNEEYQSKATAAEV